MNSQSKPESVREKIERIVDAVFLYGKLTPNISSDYQLPDGQITENTAVHQLEALIQEEREKVGRSFNKQINDRLKYIKYLPKTNPIAASGLTLVSDILKDLKTII